MTWDVQLAKLPSQAAETWSSNADILEAWKRHVLRRGAKNSQRNNITFAGVFLRSFQVLVTSLETPDIEAFIAKMGRKCSKFINSQPPQCRGNKLSIASCPLLLVDVPYESCSGYKPLDPQGVWSYICAINLLYEWLVEEGRIARNPALAVMRDFASKHSALFDERRRKPRRRTLSQQDVRLLVTQSPINHAIGYLLMAKCFLRVHEVLKLRFDEEYCNLDEGWMDIPANRDLGDKRKGNKRLVLDSEAKRWIKVYRLWWEDHVKRSDNGLPTTWTLLLTTFGKPWGSNAVHNFNTALHADAVRLGLMTGKETERQDRVNSHCFRAFSTTWARGKGISHADLQLLRGDLSPGALDRYDDYLSRLAGLYQSFGPVLSL
ncbi:MAG: site-specific integrase [Candidatus Thermoplasmatota archaeon]